MAASWDELRRAIADEPLPCALIDAGALDANIEQVVDRVRAAGKRLRVATKSIRAPGIIERVLSAAGDVAGGLMTYTAAETAWWAARGARDLLLAYPTVRAADLVHLIAAARAGATAATVVDCETHVAAIAEVARAADVVVPVVIDIDMSYRPGGLHLGVRRSPLHDAEAVVALAQRIARTQGVRFHGLMGYEAQIAGLGDRDVGWRGPAARLIKRRSRHDVASARAEIVQALSAQQLTPAIFNGGGSGSLPSSLAEGALTEVTAGSAFLCGHLFDHYRDIRFEPAAYFGLQVARRPADGFITCHGGGWIASGAAGTDRLPLPALPPGLTLLSTEGAGEVQTPLRVPDGVTFELGDPVFFRHAKAGEPAEHFAEYLVVRGARVIDRAPTYRGLGLCWLG